MRLTLGLLFAFLLACALIPNGGAQEAKKKKAKKAETPWVTPKLPDDKPVVSDVSDAFLKAPPGVLREGVTIAKTPPRVDFLFYPCQTYKGKIWSNWGDGLAANGKYYSSIGDHDAPDGNAFVYEYDPESMVLRLIANLRDILQIMMGWYTPGKIHSRLDMGKDGKLYFSTHRGSTTITTDKYGYKGDWIIRVDPKTTKAEVVAQGPVPKHCLPCSVLDPDRLIFYGGTAPGSKDDGGVHFLAYDVPNKKVLCDVPDGPARYMIFARSTGKIYYTPGKENAIGEVVCFDPAKGGAPYPIKANIGLRSATQETPDGMVYTVSKSMKKGGGATLFAFNTKTETAEEIGEAAVASNEYITSIDADPTGRYLYYIPGAHGGAQRDGTPVVQFDVKTRTRKVIAFLHPYFKDKYGATLAGTFSTAVDPRGDKLYVTWNIDRAETRAWDCCGMTVIHIPESERR